MVAQNIEEIRTKYSENDDDEVVVVENGGEVGEERSEDATPIIVSSPLYVALILLVSWLMTTDDKY